MLVKAGYYQTVGSWTAQRAFDFIFFVAPVISAALSHQFISSALFASMRTCLFLSEPGFPHTTPLMLRRDRVLLVTLVAADGTLVRRSTSDFSGGT